MPDENINNNSADATPQVETPVPTVTATTEPTPQINPVQPNNVQSVKGSKKKMFIIIAIIAFLALVGGSIIGYLSWYQNPDKIVTDAIVNAITADSSIYSATVNIKSDDYTEYSGVKVKLVVDAKKSGMVAGSMDAKLTATFNGEDFSMNGSALIDKNQDIYFKVAKIGNIVDYLKSQMLTYYADTTTVEGMIDDFVAKIDDKWIKFSMDDLSALNGIVGYIDYSSAKECLTDVAKKYGSDKATVKEISDIYIKNKFITIDEKLGQKDGSFGFKISADVDAAKEFGKALDKTEMSKAMNKCYEDLSSSSGSSSFSMTPSDSSDTYKSLAESVNESGTIELWANTWSHQMTKASIVTKDKNTSVEVIPNYKDKVEIKTPSSSIGIAEIFTDIQEIITEMGNLTYPDYPYEPDCTDMDSENCYVYMSNNIGQGFLDLFNF